MQMTMIKTEHCPSGRITGVKCYLVEAVEEELPLPPFLIPSAVAPLPLREEVSVAFEQEDDATLLVSLCCSLSDRATELRP